jgi:hypothetical protein
VRLRNRLLISRYVPATFAGAIHRAVQTNDPTPALSQHASDICTLSRPHKMAVLPIEQPRPTPAPATPMRLFLEGHRRRFVYILPELIYTLVGVLILCSIIIYVRVTIQEELRNLRKARIKGASSCGLVTSRACASLTASAYKRYPGIKSSSEFELTEWSSTEGHECLASSSKSERRRSFVDGFDGGYDAHEKGKRYSESLLDSGCAKEELDHEMKKLRWLRK